MGKPYGVFEELFFSGQGSAVQKHLYDRPGIRRLSDCGCASPNPILLAR